MIRPVHWSTLLREPTPFERNGRTPRITIHAPEWPIGDAAAPLSLRLLRELALLPELEVLDTDALAPLHLRIRLEPNQHGFATSEVVRSCEATVVSYSGLHSRDWAGGRFIASNVTLRDLVRRAYGSFFDFQIDGGPDWQTSRRFDIQAKAEDPAAGMDAMLPMLKALLAERFQRKVHTETRELPIYALVVARDDGRLGANITPSTADCSNAAQELAEIKAKAGPGAVAGLLQAGQGLPCAIMPVPARVAGGMTMRANGASMADLTRFLMAFTDRMVQDRTGLSGLYDWEMTYDRGVRLQAAPPPGSNLPLPTPPPSDSPSLMTALQEQLGLKLESTRGPVEVLVIDSAVLPEPD